MENSGFEFTGETADSEEGDEMTGSFHSERLGRSCRSGLGLVETDGREITGGGATLSRSSSIRRQTGKLASPTHSAQSLHLP